MKTRITQTSLDNIAEDNCGDSDGAWWIQSTIEDSLETLLELINKELSDKDQIVIVPEDKYLKCACEFKKRYDSNKNRDVFDHITYCDVHSDERPISIKEHIENCPECRMEHET